jgi:predicted DNA-binding protein
VIPFGPKERRVVKASLTSSAAERLDELAAEHGRTKQALLGRLIEWFGEQSRSRRVAILDNLTAEDVAELTE